jgi:hypothetical protein
MTEVGRKFNTADTFAPVFCQSLAHPMLRVEASGQSGVARVLPVP